MKYIKLSLLIVLIYLFTGCTKNITVQINSIPQDAQIIESSKNISWKAGEKVGLDVNSEGKTFFNLLVKKEGYKDAKVTLTHNNGKLLETVTNQIDNFFSNNDYYSGTVKLKKLKTILEINTIPQNAQSIVICNEKEFDNTKKFNIPSSLFKKQNQINCSIKTYLDGYKTKNQDIIIEKYQNKSYTVLLEENNIQLIIDSKPSNVDVYEKHLGYIGTTPFTYHLDANKMQNISSNIYENKSKNTRLILNFKKNGYKQVNKAVILNKNNVQKIFVNMK